MHIFVDLYDSSLLNTVIDVQSIYIYSTFLMHVQNSQQLSKELLLHKFTIFWLLSCEEIVNGIIKLLFVCDRSWTQVTIYPANIKNTAFLLEYIISGNNFCFVLWLQCFLFITLLV